jgi:hypothetical protein
VTKKECRVRQRLVTKVGKRGCRGFRARCRVCCKTGGTDCATTPETVESSVDDTGGIVEAPSFEGGTPAIEIPAGALDRPTELRIQPLAPDAEAPVRFRVQPAGLAFAAEVTLRYSSRKTPAGASVLRWRVGDGRFPLPTTREGNVLRAGAYSLGYVFDETASTRPAVPLGLSPDAPATEVDMAALDCDFEQAVLLLQIAAAVHEDDVVRAQAQFDRLVAVVEACALREVERLATEACGAYQAAALAAQSIAADSYQRFRDLVTPLLLTQAGVQVTGATCEAADVDGLLQAKFGQFLDFIEADYVRPDFAPTFDDAVRELRSLIHYDVTCQLMNLGAVCTRLEIELIPTILDRLRDAAFRECRTAESLLLLAQMYAQDYVRPVIAQLRGVRRGAPAALNAGSYFTYGRFDYEDLEDDVAHCRSTLQVRVFDDAREVPHELVERRVDLASSAVPGVHATMAEVDVPPDGSLNLSGAISTLTCPDGSLSPDELVARVNGVRLAARPANGADFAATTNPFDLVVEDVLAQAVPGGSASEFTVELLREGPACGGVFSQARTLYSIRAHVDDDGCGHPPGVQPPGSYQASCVSCTVTGTVLGCSCRRIDEQFQSTSIDFGDCRVEQDITNVDGTLTCSRCP